MKVCASVCVCVCVSIYPCVSCEVFPSPQSVFSVPRSDNVQTEPGPRLVLSKECGSQVLGEKRKQYC